jgi:FMN reductase
MTLIVALGGTVKPGSSTELALEVTAEAARAGGAAVRTFDGAYLVALPHYAGPGHSAEAGRELIEAVRHADGIIIATPAYHGTISGVVKNALDYLEDLARDERPYLDGRAVGLVATAYGHQAAMSTLQTLRAITHSLRGWPTPLGAAIRTHQGLFSANGACLEEHAKAQLELVGRQVALGAEKLAS